MSEKKDKEKHLALLRAGDLHDRGACICRHGSKPTGSPCDYQKNGFDITNSRKSMYNDKKHRIDEKNKKKAMRDIYKEVFLKAGEPMRQLKKWMGKFKEAMKRLHNDPKAWNVGYSCYPSMGKNFMPSAHGGAGWWYPYMHNWHHMIPSGATYDYIVGDDGERGVWRLHLLMLTGYNINCKENTVLLPKERFVGRALGLPVHCPYNSPNHPDYSQACDARLTKIGDMLNKAITEEECSIDFSKCQEAKDAMIALSNSLLTNIKNMYGGQSIEVISQS